MTELLPGTEVIARGLKWEVVTSQPLGQQTLYRLRCLEGVIRGEELDILVPFETIRALRRELNPAKASPLANWLVYHQAFLLEQALGQRALQAVQPGRLRLEPYQLVPVLRALRMSRVRLLLADGVGLGKTIQAGLVLTELMARRMAHRILIVSPAGPLLEQWKLEMSERFSLRFDVVNRSHLQEIRRSNELGANPFDYIPLGLVSIDFLKQERILDLLERASYDVIILDEAHHCMDLGSIGDREDSQRRRLAEVLARRCDTFLMLTATPHDGNDRSFASLCELLDPSLVDGRGSLRGDRYKRHVIRRLKRHIVDPVTKELQFKERIVKPQPVAADPQHYPQFEALQRGLLKLLAPQLKRAFRAKRYSDVLAFIALLKRSVSSVEACKATLGVVADRFQHILTQSSENQESRRQRLKTLKDYQRKLERFGTVSVEEEEDIALLEAEEIAQQLAELQREIRSTSPTVSRISNLVESLDELVSLAEAALSQDPKLDQLIREIQTIRTQEPDANILVYTEYIDSQKAAVKALEKAEIGTVIAMSGLDSNEIRSQITSRFCREANLVLISTDTAAEGLNLQQKCHHLIHLELPFNPNRLEQRNGRIDRFGQKFNPEVRYLYLQGTFEERILLRLIAKYERQRSRLTFVPNTLGVTTSSDVTTEKLLKGLIDEDEKRSTSQQLPLFSLVNEGGGIDLTDIDENQGSDIATRELLEEIDKSLKGFEQAAKTNAWLADVGMNAESQLLADAETLRAEGSKASGVDLLNFVCDAVQLDGGDVNAEKDQLFEIKLPPAWHSGTEDLPGYDRESRTVRLTTNLDITRDRQDRPVGYLGRAHPLVRRAIDRVRNLSFGGTAEQDPRVSAVLADVDQPTLLLTYVGRILSDSGREFERVVAVEFPQTGKPKFLPKAEQWLKFADRQKAIKTAKVWENHFHALWEAGLEGGQRAVESGFQPLAETFVGEFQANLEEEQSRLKEWLDLRHQEILPLEAIASQQLGLFDAVPVSEPPSWTTLDDPLEKLAAFSVDPSQPPKLRSEADGVLRLYHQRQQDLENRLHLHPLEIVPIGVLMLVPRSK
ncbi:helicase-related protein [Limnoraphis robusta Tam1]|uniref:helicase-related protein n=1 Tax=Limnoraphis robusta TaxID=1118279 RepID=UPI002B20726D|nr:helicase-related protein [Limnoraphis robusta]MEA5540353.1 helicase-related protein [Limnoraphis robusta Tam1]